jgi:hypothetical protein
MAAREAEEDPTIPDRRRDPLPIYTEPSSIQRWPRSHAATAWQPGMVGGLKPSAWAAHGSKSPNR